MSSVRPVAKSHHQVGVRLSRAILEEISEIGEMLSTPYVKATTADVIRALLQEGIPVLRTKLAGDQTRPPEPDRRSHGALITPEEPQPG